VLLTCATAALGAATASQAVAGEATLWACHGPGGQALGVAGLAAAADGDALVTTFGAGCAAPAATLADGGVRAAFTRPDPTGGSQASWRIDVPAGVTLGAVRLARRTAGFGGAPVAGGGQSYVADTSAEVLESASVADATNVALDGQLVRDPASGSYVRFGVRCVAPSLERCAAPGTDPLAVEAGAVALRVSDTEAPRGAVGGVTSPAAGTLNLSLFANDAGLGLASAQATLDGTLAAVADLGGAACAELSAQDATIDLAAGSSCPASIADVALAVDTTRVADGPHVLRVIVRDATGNSTTVAEETITVANTVVPTSNQALLALGTGALPGGGDGGGGGGGGTPGGGGGGGTGGGPSATPGPECRVPDLEMFLRGKPVRRVRGVPLLRRNVAYRYSGKLTCRVGRKRVPAATGTIVEILFKIGRRYIGTNGVTTRRGGIVSVLLALPSSRTVRFRHRSVDGSAARVDIRVSIPRPVVRKRR
jgi:hypothetical protein